MDSHEERPVPPAPEAAASEAAAPEAAPAGEPQAGDGTAQGAGVAPEPTLEDLQAELEQQRRQAEEYLDHLRRLQAEFSNYRRRVMQEQQQAASRGKEELLRALLPILDNLRLALQHADQDANAVRQGVQLIWQQFEDFLRAQGVERIAAVGEPFDPTRHEALSTAPASEAHPPNTVVAEASAGYLFQGRLLRPARVVVARAEEAPEAEAPAAPPAEA
ncbi:MAG: hypothetical protein KatS3mg131_2175 [Candidatus Tectimicrobiota bacterium]|nr:MAG: hypothetical protein KatS3mg131_2175 [Candidatus Tectomicrobia bacterium]